jgi:hypothetical protein
MARSVVHIEETDVCNKCGDEIGCCDYCYKDFIPRTRFMCKRVKSKEWPNLNRWHFCNEKCLAKWKKNGGKGKEF